MNPVLRFLYWNMNYHIEHHMFPMVPYYRLLELHHLCLADMPEPYSGLIEAYREIIPAVRRQMGDPEWKVAPRPLPPTARPYRLDLQVEVTPARRGSAMTAEEPMPASARLA
jgi:fatty acid desaturase